MQSPTSKYIRTCSQLHRKIYASTLTDTLCIQYVSTDHAHAYSSHNEYCKLTLATPPKTMPVRGSHGGTSSRCTRLSESKRSCLSWDVIWSRGGAWRKYRRSFVTYPRCRRAGLTSRRWRRSPAVNSSSRVRYGTADDDLLQRLFCPFIHRFMKVGAKEH